MDADQRPPATERAGARPCGLPGGAADLSATTRTAAEFGAAFSLALMVGGGP